MKEFLSYVAIVMSFGGLVLGIATFWRNQRWRDTDEAKTMLGRIDASESRLDKLETQLSNLATRADIARLESEFSGLEKVVKSEIGAVAGAVENMKEGVGEIRRWIMEEARK